MYFGISGDSVTPWLLTLEAREAATDDAGHGGQPSEYTVQWRGNGVLYRNLYKQTITNLDKFRPSAPYMYAYQNNV